MRNVYTSACSAVKHLCACLLPIYATPGRFLTLLLVQYMISCDVVHAVVVVSTACSAASTVHHTVQLARRVLVVYSSTLVY
jgi:hypothetical protein